MNLYTGFISGLAFPLHERLKNHTTVAVRRELERTQWLSSDAIQSLRISRLKSLLSHAHKHVPYYRDLLQDNGYSDLSTISLTSLSSLPFLTKSIIRDQQDRLKSDVAQSLIRTNTGGSSGEPLIFYLGRERVSHDVAAKWRATRWWNVDIGDKEIVVWGSPIELKAQDRVRSVRDTLFRTELLPAFEMSKENLDRYVHRIKHRRPAMLFGYPSSIALIAKHARETGVRLTDVGLKVVFVTAERLYDEQREIISQSFGCAVANGYGGRDAGFIAHECPEGNLHITAEDVIVEIVDSSGRPLPAGQPGEIVVTHLASRDFPFVRYKTGDIGALHTEPCRCGRGLPVLKSIEGRSTDFVVGSDGKLMHGLALIYVLRDIPGIRAFKIIQESKNVTRVMLVPELSFQAANVGVITNGIRRRLGETVMVNVELVDHIAPERSGKYRYVVSHAVES